MSATPTEAPTPPTEFVRRSLFIARTGTVHFATTYSWGPGPACSERFLIGQVVDGLVDDLTCKRCEVLL